MMKSIYSDEAISSHQANAVLPSLAVLVLGMHRSGTSAVTGVLAELGIPAAGEIFGEQSYNEKGLFENKAVHALHDRVLKHFGSRWDDPLPLGTSWVNGPAGSRFAEELAQIVTSELLAESRIFAVKDPRMCRLIPLWQKALEIAGVQMRTVVPLRHPLEVTASLLSRDGFPRAKSFMLWLDHMLEVESKTRGLVRSFLPYENLLADWRQTMLRTAEELDLEFPKSFARAERHIDEFLTPTLRHHKHRGEIGRATQLDAFVDETWEALLALAKDKNNADAIARLDAVRVAVADAAAVYGSYIAWEFDALNETGEALVRTSDDLNRTTLDLADARGELDRVVADNERLQSEAIRLNSLSEAMQTESENARQRFEDSLRSTHVRFDKVFGNLNSEIDRLKFEVLASNQDKRLAEERLAAIEASSVWRVSRPVRNFLTSRPGFRQFVRRSTKMTWWTLTLQLPHRLREWRVRSTSQEIISPSQSTLHLDTVNVPSKSPMSASKFPEMLELRAFEPTARIVAVVHLFYPDLWPELRDALQAIPERFDVIVTAVCDVDDDLRNDILTVFPEAQIVRFENHGRDILPFMALASAGILSRYALVCKVHAKKSPHRIDGDTWRRHLLDGILRDKDLVGRIISSFDHDPDLGIVVAEGQIYGSLYEHWEGNEAKVFELGERIGLTEIPAGATFAGGSIYWIRPFVLQTLKGLELRPDDFEPEPIGTDGTTAHALERLIGLAVHNAGMTIATSTNLEDLAPVRKPTATARTIALYLPQFHPTPENDRWWGKGFTEWSNVTRALPMFRNHRQPRLPADLGFYDLRLPEVRQAQADLAKRYGIDGFCYYHYWFDGEGVLRLPINEMLKSGKPDFPFMICWANEPWSRNWDGGNREILMPQNYKPGWASEFARDVAPILMDERYIRIDNRPMLAIYRVMHIPDREAAFEELRVALRDAGVGDVHLAGGWVYFKDDEELPTEPSSLGLDSWFEFPPHRISAVETTQKVSELEPAFTGGVYSYRQTISKIIEGMPEGHGRHRGVMMGWDNTARRLLSAHAFHDATPALFRQWLRASYRSMAAEPSSKERLLFINAWNEWAEGTYLEPDRDFGHGWLEAVASARGKEVSLRTRDDVN